MKKDLTGRMSTSSDECPGCGGPKLVASVLCRKCHMAAMVGENHNNWKGGRTNECPDCDGPKTRESARCRGCHWKQASKFHDDHHVASREFERLFRRTPKGKEHVRRMNLKKHSLTLEEYDAMLEASAGMCYSCDQPETYKNKSGVLFNLSVDHDHSCCPGDKSCGKCTRGLLCARGNRSLGLLGDSPENIINLLRYLENSLALEVVPA